MEGLSTTVAASEEALRKAKVPVRVRPVMLDSPEEEVVEMGVAVSSSTAVWEVESGTARGAWPRCDRVSGELVWKLPSCRGSNMRPDIEALYPSALRVRPS
jgi:hypothetical protein